MGPTVLHDLDRAFVMADVFKKYHLSANDNSVPLKYIKR